jgi:hypothetical protein
MKLKTLTLSLLASAILTTTSFAQESLVEQIKKRSGQIAEVKALLNDADPNTRAAALDIMLKSKDTAMRELAYATGLNSANDVLRAITLRNKFNETNILAVEGTLPEQASDKDKEMFKGYLNGGILIVNISKYDEATGRFSYRTKNDRGSDYFGSVTGLKLNFEGWRCTGSFMLNDASEFEGTLSCGGQAFPAKIQLN